MIEMQIHRTRKMSESLQIIIFHYNTNFQIFNFSFHRFFGQTVYDCPKYRITCFYPLKFV